MKAMMLKLANDQSEATRKQAEANAKQASAMLMIMQKLDNPGLLAPTRTPVRTIGSSNLPQHPLSHRPPPMTPQATIYEEGETTDGKPTWIEVVTKSRRPTLADFQDQAHHVMQLRETLKILRKERPAPALARNPDLPLRPIEVMYVKGLEGGTNSDNARAIAHTHFQMTSQRPLVFVSVMGFDISEIIVTKIHAPLVKAIITNTFGIILPDFDPLGSLETRSKPTSDDKTNLINAKNCLKRIKRCLNYQGAEVKAYYTQLHARVQDVISKCSSNLYDDSHHNDEETPENPQLPENSTASSSKNAPDNANQVTSTNNPGNPAGTATNTATIAENHESNRKQQDDNDVDMEPDDADGINDGNIKTQMEK